MRKRLSKDESPATRPGIHGAVRLQQSRAFYADLKVYRNLNLNNSNLNYSQSQSVDKAQHRKQKSREMSFDKKSTRTERKPDQFDINITVDKTDELTSPTLPMQHSSSTD